VEELTQAEAARRYPQISFKGISSALLEPEAGYLLARRACEYVAARVAAEGGEYRVAAAASPVRITDGRLSRLNLVGGGSIEADAFVFACGPWLGTLFPEAIGRLVTPTRQDVYYFGTPAGDDRFLEDRLPIWLEMGPRLMYGLPGNANRGFKIADDTSGPRFDPTNGPREAAAAGLKRARAFLKQRFPALADAPCIGSEVCQYEASPDSNYIIDSHPHAENVWLVGAGSGHGFKMGPAIGELVAGLVLGRTRPDPIFGLARFAAAGKNGAWQHKWS
jgi:glycine/D-amino acid oxidase-like deaminating enzyme